LTAAFVSFSKNRLLSQRPLSFFPKNCLFSLGLTRMAHSLFLQLYPCFLFNVPAIVSAFSAAKLRLTGHKTKENSKYFYFVCLTSLLPVKIATFHSPHLRASAPFFPALMRHSYLLFRAIFPGLQRHSSRYLHVTLPLSFIKTCAQRK
ncbi:MAG: hypothetical protein IJR87_05540, partial [Bacteroidaceae bacterium]|nr:hypothetical protein [Bacteroidaceae bacterium]